MGKIFYLMGKSASGKDTIYKNLGERYGGRLKKVIMYTTRPIRKGEQDGEEYFFSTEDRVKNLKEEGKIIELREYQTVHGPWKYFTVDDGQIDLARDNYLIIGTLQSYVSTKSYFGKDSLVPIYIEVEDGKRLIRAIEREMPEKEPKYAEICRRFLADSEDFSEENLEKAGITRRFYNENIETVAEEIAAYIDEFLEV
ncbi:MAG: guanylate kinase [Lachnospiraceae bacterium]|nr:guanylate kinase [Lachnospiraceae bacterium]